jgi:DNA-binding MltR family transcriptional regulator
MVKANKKPVRRTARPVLKSRWDVFLAIFSLTTKETDRGCIITFNALLDEALEELIKRHLVRMSGGKKLVDTLLDGKSKGALGPFSVRAKVAVAMGILSPEWLNPLLAFGKVRNDFAHHSNVQGLTQQHVDTIAGNLPEVWKTGVREIIRKAEMIPVPEWSISRTRFTCVAILLVMQLRKYINTDKRRLRLIAKALEQTFFMSLPHTRSSRRSTP